MRKNRKERKEEERRIIAEMESAMQENIAQETEEREETDTRKEVRTEKKSGRADRYDDVTPQSVHCRRCKTLMENGVCPTCGFRIYVPMQKEKRDKIRLIVAGVCMAAFVLLFIVSQIRNG